jgi:Rrf2 family protein
MSNVEVPSGTASAAPSTFCGWLFDILRFSLNDPTSRRPTEPEPRHFPLAIPGPNTYNAYPVGRTYMLTRKTKYALRALACLAREPAGAWLPIASIAARERLPRKFLERILLDLNRSGLLDSRKGRDGGYALAKPAAAISVADVVRRAEGPLAPVPCVSETAYRPCTDCGDEATCCIRPVMKQVRDAIAQVLENTSLAQLAGGQPARRKGARTRPGQ